jgi:hypothetical protein
VSQPEQQPRFFLDRSPPHSPVDVLLHYSNKLGLCDDLEQVSKRLRAELARASEETRPPSDGQTEQAERRRSAWRLDVRLGQEDIDTLIRAFRDGAPKWKLAEQYGVSLSGVKKLLRDRGVRRG